MLRSSQHRPRGADHRREDSLFIDEVLQMTPHQTRGGRPGHAPCHRDTAFSRALDAEKQRLGRRLTGAEVNEIRFRVVEKLVFKGLSEDAKKH